jgi:hypothetical protein
MLYNTPVNGSTEEVSSVLEAEAGSASRSSAGPRVHTSRQPGGAVQKVRQAGLSLRRRPRARPRLLPIRDSGTWKDSLVLRLRKTEEAHSPLPRELPKAAGAYRRDYEHQSGATGAWRTRRRITHWARKATSTIVHQVTSGPLNRANWSLNYGEFWFRCWSMP